MGLAPDLALAVQLLAADARGLGGLWVRGAEDEGAIVAAITAAFAGRPVRVLPATIDDDALLGGIDIGASLAAGGAVRRRGLLAEAAGGLVIVRGAERLPPALAGRLCAAGETGAVPAMLLLDSGRDEEAPPASLCERVGLHLLVADAADLPVTDNEPMSDEAAIDAIAGLADALGVGSVRADCFALAAARASATLAGRDGITAADIAVAARLVLAPRATRIPEFADAPPPPPPDAAAPTEPQQAEDSPEDLVLDAVAAMLPAGLLAQFAAANAARRTVRGNGAGQRGAATLRGRPRGARSGMPGSGRRLALAETLRAAAPWQRVRPGDGLKLRREDLRVKRYENRGEALAIFAVDASGSSARARLAEAKGAVELLLARAYAGRIEVALVAFRGTAAETLLPPTRSLTRARRLLAELPGGGGTPLAAGIDHARGLAEAGRARGRLPHVVMLTDGRANVAADGSANRAEAEREAIAAAQRMVTSGIGATLIDIGLRRQDEAARLSEAMHARYLHLPRADASAVCAAIEL